jgi:hypothetical protein
MNDPADWDSVHAHHVAQLALKGVDVFGTAFRLLAYLLGDPCPSLRYVQEAFFAPLSAVQVLEANVVAGL